MISLLLTAVLTEGLHHKTTQGVQIDSERGDMHKLYTQEQAADRQRKKDAGESLYDKEHVFKGPVNGHQFGLVCEIKSRDEVMCDGLYPYENGESFTFKYPKFSLTWKRTEGAQCTGQCNLSEKGATDLAEHFDLAISSWKLEEIAPKQRTAPKTMKDWLDQPKTKEIKTNYKAQKGCRSVGSVDYLTRSPLKKHFINRSEDEDLNNKPNHHYCTIWGNDLFTKCSGPNILTTSDNEQLLCAKGYTRSEPKKNITCKNDQWVDADDLKKDKDVIDVAVAQACRSRFGKLNVWSEYIKGGN